MSAARTLPRRISRIDEHNRHAGQLRFIGQKLAQLPKRPGVQYDALWPASLDPRSNMRQIFDGYRPLRAFGQSYEAFGDNVVGIGRKAAFLAAECAQPATGRAMFLRCSVRRSRRWR